MMRCAPEYRKYVDNIDRKILIPSRQTKVLCERHIRAMVTIHSVEQTQPIRSST